MLFLDGFRWDYKKHFDTPNLNIVANKGVKAKSIKPSYPTKTVPNHYTTVTGL
jgi:alkaline phosphatase D